MTEPAAGWRLSSLPSLTPAEQQAVRTLAGAVERLDGAEPLNEPALLQLATIETGVAHLLATTADNTVRGYAQVEIGPPAAAEVAVDPAGDRVALVDALVAAAEELTAAAPLLIWSRGPSPVATALTARGYVPVRTMLTMRRQLILAGSPLAAPHGIRIRPFEPGRDDAAWLAVNAAAFSHHPEQGRMTADDLRERIEQPWFDPAGFFVAEETGTDTADTDGHLLGFHWTKLHPAAAPGEDPVGEVYVLGISPAAQGRGLGRVLLDAGLRYLAAGPAREVILYVEADNTAAITLYERGGFVVDRRDVQFQRPVPASA